ncbi:SdpI family protein [uncultured Corynebacterium sp.]|uniref:SdpI family protein n=1 Tax=uncultured Corynebacterium sp. TaxID=159447 RepID=UPI0025D9A318|nr:SdpI family protein [uncultured Corynebacterium sp.]
MIVIGNVILVCAVALMVIGGMATARKLPGNNLIGLRVEEARGDQKIWELSHAVAGPVWFLAGVSFLLGGLVALNATGWMWLLVVVAVVVGVLAISIGSNMGARTAYLAAEATKNEDKPAVDLGALRNAARRADNS